MGQPFLERRDRKLDLAAHAAWLYYIAGNTQKEIAAKLNVSRQAAQRLVALAVSEKLIKFRLDHPLSECIALAESLRDQFDLSLCEVVPTDAGSGPVAIIVTEANCPERLGGAAVVMEAAEATENLVVINCSDLPLI